VFFLLDWLSHIMLIIVISYSFVVLVCAFHFISFVESFRRLAKLRYDCDDSATTRSLVVCLISYRILLKISERHRLDVIWLNERMMIEDDRFKNVMN
jgi:hypothetical protein